MSSAVWGLGIAVFVATVVEMVEALTIVLAMGMTRGWRSAIAGAIAAVGVLVVFTAVAGYSLPFAVTAGVSWSDNGRATRGTTVYARLGRAF